MKKHYWLGLITAVFMSVTASANTGGVPTNQPVNQTLVAGNAIATAASGVQKVGIADSSGNNLTSTGGSLNVALTSATNITTGPALNRITQNITATGSANGVLINVANYTSVNIKISGIYSGATLQFFSSLASTGTPSDAFQVLAYPAGGSPITSVVPGTNATAQYVANLAGPQQLLIMASALTSGTIAVEVNETTDPISIDQTVQIGNNPLVQGTKTNNAAVPGTNMLGILPAVANAAAPSWTETFLTSLSVMLNGNLRTDASSVGGGVYATGTATTTGTSDTSLVAAQGGSNKLYLMGFTCDNTGATAAGITFKNGSGGSTLWHTIVPAGGGSNFSARVPLASTSANTALFFAASQSSTTISCSATGYAGP